MATAPGLTCGEASAAIKAVGIDALCIQGLGVQSLASVRETGGEAALPCRLLRHARLAVAARTMLRVKRSGCIRLRYQTMGIGLHLPLLRALYSQLLNFLLPRGPLLRRERT